MKSTFNEENATRTQGVSAQQSLDSGHPEFLIEHNGTAAAGVGFSATKFLGKHWLINLDAAISQLRGDPAHSAIVEQRTQRVIALSFSYHHETLNPQQPGLRGLDGWT